MGEKARELFLKLVLKNERNMPLFIDSMEGRIENFHLKPKTFLVVMWHLSTHLYLVVTRH